MKNKYNLDYIKPYIIKSYLFCMGLLIVLSYIYLRVFMTYYNYDLSEVKKYVTLRHFILYLIFILIHIILCCIAGYALYKRYYNKVSVNYRIMIYIQKISNKMYWEPLEYIHDLVAPDLPYSGNLIITHYTFFKSRPLYQMKILCFVLNFLPRIFVSVVFFIDLIFYNRLLYFFYVIYLLILPVLYKLGLKLSKSFVIRNLPEIERALIVTPIGEANQHGVKTLFKFDIKPEYYLRGYRKKELDEDAANWMLLFGIHNQNENINVFLDKWSSYFTILISLLYISAGLYRLFFLFVY